jgi:hypothetical protein
MIFNWRESTAKELKKKLHAEELGDEDWLKTTAKELEKNFTMKSLAMKLHFKEPTTKKLEKKCTVKMKATAAKIS